MKMQTLSRRSLLRGAGGAAVALPWMEIMAPRRAAAQTAKKMRLVVAFGGLSPMPEYPPKTFGSTWDLGLGFRPLGGKDAMPVAGRKAYGWASVRDAFSVVSNLNLRPSGAGGYLGPWHSACTGPVLCGVSSSTTDTPHPGGITADWVYAKTLPDTLRFRWLGYRVQPIGYRGNDNRSGIGVMSHNGTSLAVPVASPRAAYDQFFRDFQAPASGGMPAPRDPTVLLNLRKERSVIDLIKGNADRLKPRLGSADQRRLDEHFTQIREMERRIASIAEPSNAPTSASCKKLPDPGADPASSTAYSNDRADRTVGYSDEDTRALVMTDLIHMAFACDHARAASLMFTYPMCFMTVEPLIGNRRVDLHDLGHGGGVASDMARAASWHVEHLARLAAKLRDTPEDDGNLLDRTVIAFVTEGGCIQETHAGDKSCVLIGGGKAGGLVQGMSIDGKGRHPANVLLSALRTVGAPSAALGEVKGPINELHS